MRILRRLHLHPSLLGTWLALLFLMPLLTACEDTGLAELLGEMALEWASEKQLVSISDDGDVSVDYIQIGAYELKRAGNKVFGGEYTTGDKALDAALDVGPIAKSIRDADKLAAEGMESKDPAKLDQAIGRRPGDWNYHDQKAAILAANGDSQAAASEIARSKELVEQQVKDGGSCRGLHQNMLRGRIAALEQQLVNDPENPILNDQLGRAQAALFALNENTAGSPCS